LRTLGSLYLALLLQAQGGAGLEQRPCDPLRSLALPGCPASSFRSSIDPFSFSTQRAGWPVVASSVEACDAPPGFPVDASIGCVGDPFRVSPGNRSFGCCRRGNIEATRRLPSFGCCRRDRNPSYPGPSRCCHTLSMQRRLPCLHLPALPAMRLRGESKIACFRRCRVNVFEFPRVRALSVSPTISFRVSPEAASSGTS